MSVVKRRSSGDNVLRRVVKPLLFIVRHFPFSLTLSHNLNVVVVVVVAAHELYESERERERETIREKGKLMMSFRVGGRLIYN